MTLRIYGKDKIFGPGLATLLKGMEEQGSLQKSAASMKLAYSKAWKMLKTAEEELGYSLADREAGGKNGGGSRLTPEGIRLLNAYAEFSKEANEAVKGMFEKHFDFLEIKEANNGRED
ncbi:MAG: LysR family transcriptional regulator [Clostridiaceae bacterium]